MHNFNNFHKYGSRGGRRDFRRQTHHQSMDGNRRNIEYEDIYQLLPARRQNRRGRNGDRADILRSHLSGRYLPHSEAGYYQSSAILQEPRYYYDEGFSYPIGPNTFRYILDEYRPQSQIVLRDHSSQRRLFPNGIQFTHISYNVLGPSNNNPISYSSAFHGYPNLPANLPSYYQEPCMGSNHSSVAEIPSCVCQSTPYFLVIESGEPPYIGIPIPPEDVRFNYFSPESPPADPDLMDD